MWTFLSHFSPFFHSKSFQVLQEKFATSQIIQFSLYERFLSVWGFPTKNFPFFCQLVLNDVWFIRSRLEDYFAGYIKVDLIAKPFGLNFRRHYVTANTIQPLKYLQLFIPYIFYCPFLPTRKKTCEILKKIVEENVKLSVSSGIRNSNMPEANENSINVCNLYHVSIEEIK